MTNQDLILPSSDPVLPRGQVNASIAEIPIGDLETRLSRDSTHNRDLADIFGQRRMSNTRNSQDCELHGPLGVLKLWDWSGFFVCVCVCARCYANWLKKAIEAYRGQATHPRDGGGSFFGKTVLGPKQSWLWDEELGLGWEGCRT